MPKFTSKPPSFPVMDVLGEIFLWLDEFTTNEKKTFGFKWRCYQKTTHLKLFYKLSLHHLRNDLF